jgi:hypothetical protein
MIFRQSLAAAPLSVARWLLSIGLAAVFFSHGWGAFHGHAHFIDLIIGSAANLLGMRVTELQALHVLTVIGVVDIAVALLVLARPSRGVLLWMATWGLITALSRMSAFGWMGYSDVLLRATHVLAPLALLWLVRLPTLINAVRPSSSTSETAR